MMPSDLNDLKAAVKKAEPELERLRDFLADQFGLTKDANFEGIYPLLLVLYASGIPQGIYLFFHDLRILERQIMNYIATLGADIKTAESDVYGVGKDFYAAGSDILNFFEGKYFLPRPP